MIDIEQLKKYNNNLKKMTTNMPNMINELAHQEGETLLGQFKNNTPVDTGLLRESWHLTISPALKITTICISNNVKYVCYVENGHRIVNKNGDTIGWCEGKFMLKRGRDFYKNNLMKQHIEKFWTNKFHEYLGM